MESLVSVLKRNSAEIAQAAADQLDLDQLSEPLTRFIELLADSAVSKCAVALDTLKQPDIDNQRIARLLRAAESHAISVIHRECEEEDVPGAVLALRDWIRFNLPRTPLNEEDVAFYHGLLDTSNHTAEPDHRRLIHFFQNLLGTLRDMVFVHDYLGNILYVNTAGLTLTGFTMEDVHAGTNIFDLVVPEHVEVVKMRLESASPVQGAPFAVDVYGRDGRRIPLEITTRPIVDSSGRVLIMGIARPMVLERRLEDVIKKSHEYIEKVLSNAPIGILTTDLTGKIIEANPAAAALFGAQDRKDIIGLPVHALREKEDPLAKRRFEELVTKARNVHSRYFGRTRFGVTVNCDVIIVPMRDDADELESLLILMVDLSEQVILEHTLHQRERLSALGTIVAGVAHELNNPLTAILGYSQLLLGQEMSEQLKTRVNKIVEEATRCEKIVENLLGFSRQVGADKELQNVNELLMQTIALREYQLRVDGIETSLQLSPEIPLTRVAPHALQSVFLNVINNAQQAMIDGDASERKLQISTSVQDHVIYVQFVDSGPGIPEPIQARIFDPFFTTKQPGEGTGLGLSVAYGIVRDHGGDLLVQSVPGSGATFTVTIPVDSREVLKGE